MRMRIALGLVVRLCYLSPSLLSVYAQRYGYDAVFIIYILGRMRRYGFYDKEYDAVNQRRGSQAGIQRPYFRSGQLHSPFNFLFGFRGSDAELG